VKITGGSKRLHLNRRVPLGNPNPKNCAMNQEDGMESAVSSAPKK